MKALSAGTARTDGRVTASGMRRIDFVRLVVGGDHIRAEVVGVGYRLPTAIPVSMPYAARLIAGGTPSVTRHVRAARARQAETDA